MAQTRTSPEGITQQLAKALAHPLRVQHPDLAAQGHLEPQPALAGTRRAARQRQLPRQNAARVRLRRTGQNGARRGAVEHFYRATERAFFSDSRLEEDPGLGPQGHHRRRSWRPIGQDATEALIAGHDRRPHRLARQPHAADCSTSRAGPSSPTLLADDPRTGDRDPGGSRRLAARRRQVRRDRHPAGDPPLRGGRRERRRRLQQAADQRSGRERSPRRLSRRSGGSRSPSS